MKKLDNWLLTNAMFSLLSGMTMLLANGQLQLIFGFENDMVFSIIGVNLLAFFGFVYWVKQIKTNKQTWVYAIVVMDALWVMGSLILLLFDPFEVTELGQRVIGLVAILVAIFGVQQIRFLQS